MYENDMRESIYVFAIIIKINEIIHSNVIVV